jgi:hypothetical protein
MFATTRDVERLTGYVVTQDVLSRAQAILEVYIGRIEQDVTNMKDNALLGRALAYQAAYMRDNSEQIFEHLQGWRHNRSLDCSTCSNGLQEVVLDKEPFRSHGPGLPEGIQGLFQQGV